MPRARSGERVLLTFFVGSLWALGYIAVPVIFATLDDKTVAAGLAGRLFTVGGYVGLFVGALLLMLRTLRCGLKSGWIVALVVALGLMAVVQFGLQPAIVAAQAAGTTDTENFALLHRAASTLYLLVSVIGLGLVVFDDSPELIVNRP